MNSPAGDQLTMLVEFEALRALKARYCRLVDERNWSELRGLFTDDCLFHTDAQDRGSVVQAAAPLDPDTFIALISKTLTSGSMSFHQVNTPELALLSQSEATGIWAMTDYVLSERRRFRGYGRYHERYRKVDGQWRISEWRLVRTRIDAIDAENSGVDTSHFRAFGLFRRKPGMSLKDFRQMYEMEHAVLARKHIPELIGYFRHFVRHDEARVPESVGADDTPELPGQLDFDVVTELIFRCKADYDTAMTRLRTANPSPLKEDEQRLFDPRYSRFVPVDTYGQDAL